MIVQPHDYMNTQLFYDIHKNAQKKAPRTGNAHA